MANVCNTISIDSGDVFGDISIYTISSVGHLNHITSHHNALSFFSSTSFARAFGGDTTWVPAGIGFVFNKTSDESDTLPLATNRACTWNDLREWCASSHGNILKCGFSSDQTYSSSDDSYVNNIVTFHSCTNNSAMAFTGDVFESDFNRACIRQVVLYSGTLCNSDDPEILSRANALEKPGCIVKPDGFDLAIDWSITFK